MHAYPLHHFLTDDTGWHASYADIVRKHLFPTDHVFGGDTSSLHSTRCLVQWLDDCTQNHPDCRRDAYRKPTAHKGASVEYNLPKRILEIYGSRVVLRERLASKDSYICLSHCWGSKGVTFRLESSTIQMLKASVSISALPKTFRDAVLVCLRLGFRFLWIDALCIVQDSVEDWEEAVATMAGIYEDAFLTIAATASKDSCGGLFSDQGSPYLPRRLKTSILHVVQRQNYGPRKESTQNAGIFGDCPLLERAWVFQERHLSSRVVHFAEHQLIWECRSMRKSECQRLDLDWTNRDPLHTDIPSRIPFKMPIKDTARSWQATVQAYSELELTYAKDRLPALSAIVARRMRSRPNDEYVAGMWKDTLMQDLNWHSLNEGFFPGLRSGLPVPTWSWVHVRGAITFEPLTFISATCLGITYRRVSHPQIGNVANASIRVRGRSVNAYLRRSARQSRHVFKIDIDSRACGYSNLCDFWFQSDYVTSDGPRSWSSIEAGTTQCSILFLGHTRNYHGSHWQGLVFCERSPGEYERIGMVRAYCYAQGWVDTDTGPPINISSCQRTARTLRRAQLKKVLGLRFVHQFVFSLPLRTFAVF
ncbi:heterokaryon incompatibility protein-domain-containing protein [Boeremia exigua]|uniref:heterokaryon incompatibility protein-domain-containing protein n=1 Tax=Boeremia exigua TaxID=749465 RepID=UPI001E8EEDDB|nr:heterokaryon incompatibility protein-domain-containing protein [Boeremia exigua]KAH6625472.1 heterokaryon incompatibility protein-domain-containing protein [Boeremia exigua]